MYSRVAALPLTTIATLASGTSTPFVEHAPGNQFAVLTGAEALQHLAPLARRVL